MSTSYTTEPPTKGKVVLHTTFGPLDIELWPKEAPMATRNFVQLCAEGYYDGTPFFRMVKVCLLQGGDPSGTGEGGESIFGHPFKDEFHSRLRFTHRGLVACAGEHRDDQIVPNSNNSQFFIVFDHCQAWNRRHTIFGKITGDSQFNLANISEVEVDADDKPLDPHAITRAEVLWNPFDDLAPRTTPEERKAKREEQEAAAKAK
eukprot:jgi/Astpho2/637/e_gw1.00013.170.1_t